MFRNFQEYRDLMKEVVGTLTSVSPSLAKTCFLHGTTPIVCRESPFGVKPWATSADADWVTKEFAEVPEDAVRELRNALGKRFHTYEADGEYGIYRAVIRLPNRPAVNVDILSGFEDTDPDDLEPSTVFPGVMVATEQKYFRDKIQCVSERKEPKDLFHLCSICANPTWERRVMRNLGRLPGQLLDENIDYAKNAWNAYKKYFPALPGMTVPDERSFRNWLEAVPERIAFHSGQAQPTTSRLPKLERLVTPAMISCGHESMGMRS